LNETRPTLRQRLYDTLFLRRADQTVVALLILAAGILVALWWWRNGGADGRLVDFDRLPERHAAFVVNVNTAPLVELAELPGIGPTLAERIVEYRETRGPFRSLEDLRTVKGIGAKTLDALTPHVRFDDLP
jgi:competence protein ComEA